jgi:biotin carboxyl carrier protein
MGKSSEVKARAKKIAGYRKARLAKAKKAKKARTAKPVRSEADENMSVKCGDGKIRCKSLVIDGTKYRTRYNKKFENRKKWSNENSNKIISVIPGTVLKLFAAEGERVSAGDEMMILEAMKMKNRILFPKDGIVKSLMVREGEKIPKGFLMVELEE